MICPLSFSSETQLAKNGFFVQRINKTQHPLLKPIRRRILLCAQNREKNPKIKNQIPSKQGVVRYIDKSKKGMRLEDITNSSQVGAVEMVGMCGFGYWVQGFRCFPWLALNFHMAHNLAMHPSVLQLVQNSGNLPMVAKPLYGILSDAFYINGAHRLPYISIGGRLVASLFIYVIFNYSISRIFVGTCVLSYVSAFLFGL